MVQLLWFCEFSVKELLNLKDMQNPVKVLFGEEKYEMY